MTPPFKLTQSGGSNVNAGTHVTAPSPKEVVDRAINRGQPVVGGTTRDDQTPDREVGPGATEVDGNRVHDYPSSPMPVEEGRKPFKALS
jgi:hypothetical protein